MVRAVRRAGRHTAIANRMKLLTLDTLKYRIPNPSAKSPIRRVVERRFASVKEITGLYERMHALLDDAQSFANRLRYLVLAGIGERAGVRRRRGRCHHGFLTRGSAIRRREQ
jgi:hypothetical protein